MADGRSFIIQSRMRMDGLLRQPLGIDTPFTTGEPLNAHIFCVRK